MEYSVDSPILTRHHRSLSLHSFCSIPGQADTSLHQSPAADVALPPGQIVSSRPADDAIESAPSAPTACGISAAHLLAAHLRRRQQRILAALFRPCFWTPNPCPLCAQYSRFLECGSGYIFRYLNGGGRCTAHSISYMSGNAGLAVTVSLTVWKMMFRISYSDIAASIYKVLLRNGTTDAAHCSLEDGHGTASGRKAVLVWVLLHMPWHGSNYEAACRITSPVVDAIGHGTT